MTENSSDQTFQGDEKYPGETQSYPNDTGSTDEAAATTGVGDMAHERTGKVHSGEGGMGDTPLSLTPDERENAAKPQTDSGV